MTNEDPHYAKFRGGLLQTSTLKQRLETVATDIDPSLRVQALVKVTNASFQLVDQCLSGKTTAIRESHAAALVEHFGYMTRWIVDETRDRHPSRRRARRRARGSLPKQRWNAC